MGLTGSERVCNAGRLQSFKRSMSLTVEKKADEVTGPEPEPTVDVVSSSPCTLTAFARLPALQAFAVLFVFKARE